MQPILMRAGGVLLALGLTLGTVGCGNNGSSPNSGASNGEATQPDHGHEGEGHHNDESSARGHHNEPSSGSDSHQH